MYSLSSTVKMLLLIQQGETLMLCCRNLKMLLAFRPMSSVFLHHFNIKIVISKSFLKKTLLCNQEMCDIFKAAVRTELHVWKNTSMTGSWDSNIPRLCFQLSCKILLTLTVHNLNYKWHKIQNKRARTVCGPGQKDPIFFSFHYLVLTLTKAHNNTNIFPSFYLKFKILMTVVVFQNLENLCKVRHI